MADNLIQSVQEMLKEETWTRATISNYTQGNLKELADIVEKAKSEGCVKELRALCEEQLSHTKDSIIALYLDGIFALQSGVIDNSSLETLVDIFQKNHKEAIVTYLCESILEDSPNNLFALRTLAASYFAENNEKVWDFYAKIVKIDFEEAELAKVLADHYLEKGDTDLGREYLKKAILRYIKIMNYNATKDMWTRLVQEIPTEIDFFQLVRRKIAKTFGEIKTTTLMQELYAWYKDNQKWDIAIDILKQNLNIEPKDSWARKEITDCFRGKYATHSHLEDYIKSSNLTQSYRNIFEAINDFEKHIAFDKGSFVFHRSWNVGRIKELKNDTLIINFGKHGIKEMSLKIAISALQPLDKTHIWVVKATTKSSDKEKLVAKIKNEKEWALETIIKSFDNNCDIKTIKAELVPSILTPGEWTSWNTAAKKILESNPKFIVNPNDNSKYQVVTVEMSPEEKISNEFKANKQFFPRVEILMKFFNNDITDKSSDLFAEMYSYFTGFLKNITKVNEQVIASYLICKNISAINKQFIYPVKETFAELYGRLEDPRQTYSLLKDSKNFNIRQEFLEAIKMLPDWNEQYIKLFPSVLNADLIETLVKAGYVEDVKKLVVTCFEQYKDFRETVLFFFKNCQNEEWFNSSNVSYEKQLITLINIIVLTFREINNHVNSTENKKINKNATVLLFENDEPIYKYMFSGDEDLVKKLYTLIDDITDLDPSYKQKTRNKILEKYPNFKFRVSEEKSSGPKGIIVTAAKLEEKRAEIDRIQNIEIPANATEIADAREKGDLKENAEYKSAKEKQHMLNLSLAKLQEELNRATVFDPTTSTTAVVSFATIVTLHNNETNSDETYTILGPWESDPENNIISYMSPFGNAIMDKKVNDKADFIVNEHKYSYIIKDIKKASI